MPSPPKGKPWYASKTIWINTIAAAVAAMTALQGQQLVADNPGLAAGLVIAITTANIALRVVTILPLE